MCLKKLHINDIELQNYLKNFHGDIGKEIDKKKNLLNQTQCKEKTSLKKITK